MPYAEAVEYLKSHPDATTQDLIDDGIASERGTPISRRTARRYKKNFLDEQAAKIGVERKKLEREEEEEREEREQEPVFTESDGMATAFVSGNRITNIPELIEACKVDLSIWEPQRAVVKKWEMGRKATVKSLWFDQGKITGQVDDSGELNSKEMISIKVILTLRKTVSVEKATEKIVEKLKKYTPKYKAPKYVRLDNKHIGIPSFYDVHFNKLSLDGSWTLEQTNKVLRRTCDALIARAQDMKFPISKWLMVVGHDVFHTDGNGTTTAGTKMETVTHHSKAIEAGYWSYVYIFEQLAQTAPVEGIITPGNHDYVNVFWLGLALRAHFRNHKGINIELSAAPRQYFYFGKTLFGLTHGNAIKDLTVLANCMSVESPLWSDAAYRVWLLGHFHRQRKAYVAMNEEVGVFFEFMPALCPTDAWHDKMGYVNNNRGAKTMIFSEEEGPVGSFNTYLKELAI